MDYGDAGWNKMREWTINIEGAHDQANEALADLLIEALGQYAPAVSFSNSRLGVTMSVVAETPGHAVDIAVTAFMAVVSAPAARVEVDLAA